MRDLNNTLPADSPPVHNTLLNTIFYYQIAAWVLDMFCDIYLVKNNKIANLSSVAHIRKSLKC